MQSKPTSPMTHGTNISLDTPDATGQSPQRPANVTHLSSPSYDSPLRHHRRQVSTPREVKETLHARSSYTNSEDDGGAIHRINQYIIKQEIGRGSFGAVHLAVDHNDCEYAVKEFSKARLRKRAQSHVLRRPHGSGPRPGHLAAGGGLNSPLHRRVASDIHNEESSGNPLYLIREEIAIMKKLNHNNLVSLLEVLDDPTEDSLYMVLEMCKKGVVMKIGMGERADPYEPESCRCWFRDLILGIEYLHAQGIVHRDIKPDNLLLTSDDVLKIVDFGVSEMFEKESDMTTAKSAGSPAFLPPELCISKHGKISGKAADIWSMGVTLHCLYFGRVPFEKTSVLELYESIKNDNVDLESNCEKDFADLMHRILEKDPQKRINMHELRSHPWVTKNGKDPLLSYEENTAHLAEPPTEEEMKQAITGNLSNLIVVMKAVRRFKGLLEKRRPYIMDSILGQTSRIVQPPQSMERAGTKFQKIAPPPLQHHAYSDDTQDRRAIEQALVREGVHRKINPDNMVRPAGVNFDVSGVPPRHQIGATPDHSTWKSYPRDQSRSMDSGKVGNDHAEHGKGQAHDPLSDFLYLSIGTGTSEEAENVAPPAVSESPPASEVDIYETAYHEEVERIRSNSRATTLYLTRRVRQVEAYENDQNMVQGESADEPSSHASAALGRLLGKAKGKGKQAKSLVEERSGETTTQR